jgi:hypothetical protein
VRITPVAEDDIEGLSCPSTNLCVAVTGHGWVLTTTRPTGGASAWHGFRSGADGLVGLACHSGSACVAYDGLGNIVSSNDPTGGRSAWTRPIMVDRTAELDGISCPTARRCVAVDGNGDAQTIDPSSSRPTWTAPRSIDRAPPSSHSSRALTTVACPSARLCVAADDVGNVIVGRAG